MNTAACDLCGRQFDRPDRAQVRRSLRRHLMQHHAHNEPAAVERASTLVPRKPQEPLMAVTQAQPVNAGDVDLIVDSTGQTSTSEITTEADTKDED